MNPLRFFTQAKRRKSATTPRPESPELRKAAVFIASLDARTADALLDRMQPADADLIRRAALALGKIDPAEQASVLAAFAGAESPDVRPSGHAPAPREEAVELQLSTGAARPTVDSDLAGTHFRLLRAASGDKLRPLLEGEHPQTIALVISHLPAERAAEMLATLSGDLQVDIVRRLVNLEQANPDVLLEVERGLESRMLEQTIDERREAAGIASMAAILSAASPLAKREILSNLARRDRRLVGRLVDRELHFSDLEQVSNTVLAAIIEAAGMQLTMLALAGAGPTLHDRMLAAVPTDTAALLTGALEGMGPTRLSDVEEAQHEFVRLARQLEAEGRLDLSGALVEIAA